MFPNQCDDCFAEQEELLERNPGGCGQVVCFCYIPEDDDDGNVDEISDDEELETAIMILGDDEDGDMGDDALVIAVEDISATDGFEKELLANYQSQDYMFVYKTDLDAACQKMEEGEGRFFDWMQLNISWDAVHEFL